MLLRIEKSASFLKNQRQDACHTVTGGAQRGAGFQ
jgi:hypothetical protein